MHFFSVRWCWRPRTTFNNGLSYIIFAVRRHNNRLKIDVVRRVYVDDIFSIFIPSANFLMCSWSWMCLFYSLNHRIMQTTSKKIPQFLFGFFASWTKKTIFLLQRHVPFVSSDGRKLLHICLLFSIRFSLSFSCVLIASRIITISLRQLSPLLRTTCYLLKLSRFIIIVICVPCSSYVVQCVVVWLIPLSNLTNV